MLDKVTGMKTANGEAAAATVLVIGAGAGLFAAFCPSWFTVRSSFFNEQDGRKGNRKAIRQGEVAGTVTTLLQGAGASHLVKSPLPFLGAVAVCVVMIWGYEWSLAHPAVEEGNESPLGPAMKWRAA
jgi:hypothetical protein